MENNLSYNKSENYQQKQIKSKVMKLSKIFEQKENNFELEKMPEVNEIKKLRKTARKFLNGRVQNLMFTIVASYNLIRLFGIIKENKMDLFSVISSIRFIALN